jgi:small multidrug resistance pump
VSPWTWAALLGAIACEVAGTSLLQASQQFTRPWPTAGMAVCYGLAFYLLSVALKQMPVGIAYAIWSGLGVVAISIIGAFFFRQRLDLPALAGLAMIVGGVAVIHLFFKNRCSLKYGYISLNSDILG